jgi:hypothetical protein
MSPTLRTLWGGLALFWTTRSAIASRIRPCWKDGLGRPPCRGPAKGGNASVRWLKDRSNLLLPLTAPASIGSYHARALASISRRSTRVRCRGSPAPKYINFILFNYFILLLRWLPGPRPPGGYAIHRSPASSAKSTRVAATMRGGGPQLWIIGLLLCGAATSAVRAGAPPDCVCVRARSHTAGFATSRAAPPPCPNPAAAGPQLPFRLHAALTPPSTPPSTRPPPALHPPCLPLSPHQPRAAAVARRVL